MKRHPVNKGALGLALMLSCLGLSGRERNAQAPAWEATVNKRQPPELVLKAIGIKPGSIIGEVGAGTGRYTVEIAARIGPSGRVYANDIDQEALKFLEKRCAGLGLKNVEIVTGSLTETNLPAAALDMVIMVNVVHCLAEPVALLENVGDSLKPDGQVVIVEGNLDKDPSSAGEWFARGKLLKIYQDAGYVLVREETFLPKDNIYFLKKR
jgi:precorrin-6B methylase 2